MEVTNQLFEGELQQVRVRTWFRLAIWSFMKKGIHPGCWCCPVMDVCRGETITGPGIAELKARGNCVTPQWRWLYG